MTTSPPEGPLGRRPKIKATDEIIDSLRDDIISGRLPRGGRMLSEKQLATLHQVSQPTVREALRALEVLGLVDVHHGSGTFVSNRGQAAFASALMTMMQLEEVGVVEVQDIRAMIGCGSIERATLVASEEQLQSIEAAVKALEDIDEAKTTEAVLRRVIDFHKAMANAANNPLLLTFELLLATLLTELQADIVRKRSLRAWRVRIESLRAERRAIYTMMVSRDVAGAGAAARLYYDKVRRGFQADPDLRAARLSDPAMRQPVADIVRRIRTAAARPISPAAAADEARSET